MECKIRNPVSVIIFSIISCGIYSLYWQWVTNKQINALLGSEDVGDGILVLGWFCFPVLWYNWYKWDKSMLKITADTNVSYYNSSFILWVILSVIGGVGYIVCMFQIQEALNSLYAE